MQYIIGAVLLVAAIALMSSCGPMDVKKDKDHRYYPGYHNR